MPVNPYYFDDVDDIIILPENHKKIMKMLGQNGAFKSKAWFAGQILHQALEWFSSNYNNNAAINRNEKQEKGTYVPFGLSTALKNISNKIFTTPTLLAKATIFLWSAVDKPNGT